MRLPKAGYRIGDMVRVEGTLIRENPATETNFLGTSDDDLLIFLTNDRTKFHHSL